MSRYAFNPFPLFRVAATGEADAMREIARKGSEAAVHAESDAAMIVAVTFARLAYYRTGTKEDAGLLVTTLALASDLFGPCELQDEARAEAIAVLDTFDGDELISEGLLGLVDGTPREVVALAKDVSQMMKERA